MFDITITVIKLCGLFIVILIAIALLKENNFQLDGIKIKF